MVPGIRVSDLYYRACCLVLYFVAASAAFNGYYGKWHLAEAGAAGEDDRFHFEMMVDGTAYRPYIYRQLLPTAANWIDRALPRSFESWLYDLQSGPAARMDPFFDSPAAENPVYFFRYLIVYAGTFLFTLLAVYAMHLVCQELAIPPPAAALAPAIVILLIPYLQSGGGFFYDYPELAFLALAVWAALKFDWGWIVPVAALATWNKESFLFFRAHPLSLPASAAFPPRSLLGNRCTLPGQWRGQLPDSPAFRAQSRRCAGVALARPVELPWPSAQPALRS